MNEQETRYHDHGTERALLGALLILPERFDSLDTLSPTDFHDNRNGWIFGAMRRIHTEGGDFTDLARLSVVLADKLPELDHGFYLSELLTGSPSPFNLTDHAVRVKELAGKRALYLQLQGAMGKLHRGEQDGQDIATICDGLVEDLQELGETAGVGVERYFTLETLAEVISGPDKVWLIDQVLGKGDLAMIFGPSGAGKTFVAINLAMMLARGTGEMAGEFTVNGPVQVVYMTAEGRSGLGQRFSAAVKSFGLTAEEQERVRVIRRVVQFVDPQGPSYFTRFLQDLKAQGFTPGAVIIDHLSSTVPGKGDSDQAAATEVGQAISHIQDELDCAVVLIHHTGYDTTHSRGMTNYKDILDMQIKATGLVNPHTLHCEKNKDGVSWPDRLFTVTPVDGTKSCTIEWGNVVEIEGNVNEQLTQLFELLEAHPDSNQSAIVELAKGKFGWGRNMTRNRLNALTDADQVLTTAGSRGELIYSVIE